MDTSLATQYWKRLCQFEAKFLYGYPSILYLFVNYMKQMKVCLPRLRAVVTTAEMLQKHYRESISDVLGCPVYNNYGSNDGGIESFECHYHSGLHYNDLQSVLETEEGSSYPSGGRLVITNLWNRSTPFIRYENGDLAVLADEPCGCGAQFPMIASIAGRTADILTFDCGRSLSGPALTLIFGDMRIDGWQVAQTGPNQLDVRVLTHGELKDEYISKIMRVLNYHLGNDVQVCVSKVSQLTHTRNGKLKPIIKEYATNIA